MLEIIAQAYDAEAERVGNMPAQRIDDEIAAESTERAADSAVFASSTPTDALTESGEAALDILGTRDSGEDILGILNVILAMPALADFGDASQGTTDKETAVADQAEMFAHLPKPLKTRARYNQIATRVKAMKPGDKRVRAETTLARDRKLHKQKSLLSRFLWKRFTNKQRGDQGTSSVPPAPAVSSMQVVPSDSVQQPEEEQGTSGRSQPDRILAEEARRNALPTRDLPDGVNSRLLATMRRAYHALYPSPRGRDQRDNHPDSSRQNLHQENRRH